MIALLLLTWLVVSVPVSLLLGRAMSCGSGVPEAHPAARREWHEPAAA